MSNLSLGGNVSINLSEHILLKALNYTGAGVLITDPVLPDNPIVFANKSFAAMTGYSMEEVMGRIVASFKEVKRIKMRLISFVWPSRKRNPSSLKS